MFGHGCHLGYDSAACPLDTKDLCELLEILRAGLTNAEDRVAQPRHAQTAEFLVEELDAELRSQKRDVLNDGQSNAPLLIFCKLHDGRKKRLRQKLDANNIVDLLQLGDDIQSDIREIVLEHL